MEQNSSKEMHLLDTPKDDDEKPQEVKDWEEKCLQETNNKNNENVKENNYNENTDLCINNTFEEKAPIVTKETENTEQKEYKINNLVLNSFWINLVSKISIGVTILICEIVGFFAIGGLIELLDPEGDPGITKDVIILIVFKIGAKWIFIIVLGLHLSIGFFSLTNFSSVIKDTKSNLKFYTTNLLKFSFFYVLSILILKKLIHDYAYNRLVEEIDKLKLPGELYKTVIKVVDLARDVAIKLAGNILGLFNNSLDQLIFRTFYFTLFRTPTFIPEKYMRYFRLSSIAVIIYVALCLLFRALNNFNAITLSLYASPLLVGPKFTVFGFYFTLLLYIKIKEKKYKMYDEEGNLLPTVFAKLSSKIFAIFGFIELFGGLFSTNLFKAGIGPNYLIIICAPIMTLYDYKKEYELHIRPCKKLNLAKCINITISVILYILLFFSTFLFFGMVIWLIDDYIYDFVKFIVENAKNIIQILKEF